MQHYKQNEIEWLQFDLLSDIPFLQHATFLRHGGYSQGPYHSLNVAADIGDSPDAVSKNLELIQKHFDGKPLIRMKQVHGHDVIYIKEPTFLKGDALITDQNNYVLMVQHADCQAAIFYDPQQHAIANVHAGWRGNVANIYAKTIEAMQKAFGSKPEELLVCISPSLGPDEAEFIYYTNELPEEFWHFQTRATFFDLWAISEYQLQEAGILPHHIEIARISTYSNSLDYFSYRRDKITGRHATCVRLLAH